MSHYHEDGVYGMLAKRMGWKNVLKSKYYLKTIVRTQLTCTTAELNEICNQFITTNNAESSDSSSAGESGSIFHVTLPSKASNSNNEVVNGNVNLSAPLVDDSFSDTPPNNLTARTSDKCNCSNSEFPTANEQPTNEYVNETPDLCNDKLTASDCNIDIVDSRPNVYCASTVSTFED